MRSHMPAARLSSVAASLPLVLGLLIAPEIGAQGANNNWPEISGDAWSTRSTTLDHPDRPW